MISFWATDASIPPAPAADPYWANVTSLLRFEGANGSLEFNDDTGRLWSPDNEKPFISTDQFQFGEASGYFDGINDYIATPADSGFQLETNDFTLECWLRPINNVQGTILTNRLSGTRGWLFRRETDASIGFYWIGGDGSFVRSGGGTVPAGAWTYVRVDRDSSGVRLTVGASLAASIPTYPTSPVSSEVVSIGATLEDSANFRRYAGYIDSFRLTTGLARPLGTVPPASDYLGSGVPYATEYLVSEGVWTWFNDQRALLASSGQLLVGSVGNDGNINCAYSDDVTTGFSNFELADPILVDDHNNPSFVELADGKILTAYTEHNTNVYNVRKTTAAGDAATFGAQTNIAGSLGGVNFSYSNLIALDNGDIINFFRRNRSPDWTIYYTISSDGGATWSAAQQLFTGGGRPYFKCVKSGPNRIDFTCTDGHPDTVTTNSVYHGYYDSGTFYDSAGVTVGAAPFAVSALTQVYDGSGPSGRGWIWDIAVDGLGEIAIAIATFPSTTDHRYRYARFNGSSWSSVEVIAAGTYLYAGEPYYSAGFCIDPDDINTIYTAIGGGTKSGISRRVTSDGGATFGGVTSLKVRGNVIRPFKIKDTPYLSYVKGIYTSYTNYVTFIYLTDF